MQRLLPIHLTKPIFPISAAKYQDRKVLTLVFIHKGNELLLGMKKRGFGAGKWNGAGGKVEKGETIAEGAQRELQEEFGVTAVNPEQMGILFFEFDHQYEDRLLECHVFKSGELQGQIEETEEMKPEWFNVDQIPYDVMWPDDKLWFPQMLQNKRFAAHFIFSDFNTIVKHEIRELNQEE